MLSNYIKIAFRALSRHKLTSFINIAGLGLGLACCLLIFLFVEDELGYDQHHRHSDRIYRVTRSFHSTDGDVSLHLAHVAPPIGPLLSNDFGEIEKLARVLNSGMVISLEENGVIKTANNEEHLFIAEPELFDIFDIVVKSGDPHEALSRPFTVMLSEKAAMRYFNSLDVVGKRLRADSRGDLEVTGVFEDFPAQSHWHPEFLVSFKTLEDDNIYGRTGLETNWGNNSFSTYILLGEGAEPTKLESRFPEFLDNHFGTYVRNNFNPSADFRASKITSLYLQKVTDIHLRSHLDDEIEANGNINNVYMMTVIGLFIILIACFNFVNLSTARATKRAKEVGMRKVAGAFRHQLILQYLSESVVITTIALLFALAAGAAGLEWLNSFTGKSISLSKILDWKLLSGVAVFSLVLGILAGIYPAFIISGFKPALTLKGMGTSGRGNVNLRRGLVVVQFSISIVLVIATLLTFQQLDYLNSRELGYNKEMLITLPNYRELNNQYDAFYNEVTSSSRILNIGRSSRIPTGRLLDSYGSASIMEGDSLMPTPVSLKTLVIDDRFFDTYNIEMASGRNFSKNIVTDDSLAFIVNEAAAREFGWTDFKEHIDQEFLYAGTRGKLIGIVKDFHFESLHQRITPMVFVNSNRFNVLSVKIGGGSIQESIAELEKHWKAFLPERPFDFQFLSEQHRALYVAEHKQSTLFTTFSILAIFIASLGLFGLATFNVMQRLKEIGIRKVLGATVPQVLGLLSRETVILILAANVIAWPVAWYLMREWLNTFAYHIEMNLLVYITAAVAAIVLALVTVGVQSLKAATSNPAKTLKYE